MAGRPFIGAGGGGGMKLDEGNPRVIFIGGLTWDTTDVDLQQYFSRYGEIRNIQIKYDPMTGRSRGFGFIEFGSPEIAQEILKTRHHTVKGKQCEVKRAVSRENKKIFVGGVSGDMSEAEIRAYFSRYGEVDEVELPIDHNTQKRRNFCFVIFKEDAAVDAACEDQKQMVGDRYCDIKKATPMRLQNQQGGNGEASGHNFSNYGYGGGGPGGMPPATTGNPQSYNDYYQAWYNYYWSNYANWWQQQAAGGQQQQPAPQHPAAPDHSNPAAAAAGGWGYGGGYGYPQGGYQNYPQTQQQN